MLFHDREENIAPAIFIRTRTRLKRFSLASIVGSPENHPDQPDTLINLCVSCDSRGNRSTPTHAYSPPSIILPIFPNTYSQSFVFRSKSYRITQVCRGGKKKKRNEKCPHERANTRGRNVYISNDANLIIWTYAGVTTMINSNVSGTIKSPLSRKQCVK